MWIWKLENRYVPKWKMKIKYIFIWSTIFVIFLLCISLCYKVWKIFHIDNLRNASNLHIRATLVKTLCKEDLRWKSSHLPQITLWWTRGFIHGTLCQWNPYPLGSRRRGQTQSTPKYNFSKLPSTLEHFSISSKFILHAFSDKKPHGFHVWVVAWNLNFFWPIFL